MTAGERPPVAASATDDGDPIVLPAVVPVGRGVPRGVPVVAAMAVIVLAAGLVRPWDWLPGGATAERALAPVPGLGGEPHPAGDGAATGRGPGAGRGEHASPRGSASPGSTGGSSLAPRCASPMAWRVATLQIWAGLPARIWSAVDAVAAADPLDPAIPFRVIGSSTVTALGWCAPVDGSERPPDLVEASLFRLAANRAVAVPFDRVEPGWPDPLGELLAPPLPSRGARPAWAAGRYVIRLAGPGGSFVRYIGLDLGQPGVGGQGASPSPATPTGGPSGGEELSSGEAPS